MRLNWKLFHSFRIECNDLATFFYVLHGSSWWIGFFLYFLENIFLAIFYVAIATTYYILHLSTIFWQTIWNEAFFLSAALIYTSVVCFYISTFQWRALCSTLYICIWWKMYWARNIYWFNRCGLMWIVQSSGNFRRLNTHTHTQLIEFSIKCTFEDIQVKRRGRRWRWWWWIAQSNCNLQIESKQKLFHNCVNQLNETIMQQYAIFVVQSWFKSMWIGNGDLSGKQKKKKCRKDMQLQFSESVFYVF